jgi:hypothetical protein
VTAKQDSETKSESEVSAQGVSGNDQSPSRNVRHNFDFADMSALGGPRFILTVDTEEEFDWRAPFSRDGYATSHLKAVPRFQEFCAEQCVAPCYLVDFPIAQDAFGVDLLGGYAQADVAEIGVQLHPWVNPPFDETVSVHNSYACNLPEPLERAKLTALHAAIVDRFGVKPDAYRAGRYGAGPNTAAILEDLGIAIDSSVRSRFDYSDQGGPDYTYHPLTPYWLRRGRVLELPLTTMFAGALRSAGPVMFGEMFSSQTARSVLARSKMLERIALTPEGIPLGKALQGIDLAMEKGVSVINLSLHSPSLAVGHTPYVQDAHQLQQLYAWFEAVFAHMQALGVRPTTMAEIKRAALFPVAV